jgi:RNA polymerase sigma-70 factor (ECF subfamily)
MRKFPEKATDPELAQAIRRSDMAAFKVLYYRYYKSLYRFVWHRTRDSEQCLDFVQEIFARLWKNRGSLDPKQKLKAYLYQVGNNLLIDHFRQKEVRRDYLAEKSKDEPFSLPDDEFDLKEKMQQEINNLSEPLRTVFTLKRFDGYKNAEIADMLNVSVKTVESRMSKAIKKLREKLKPFLMLLIVLTVFLKLI